eukprot:gene12465-15671_t
MRRKKRITWISVHVIGLKFEQEKGPRRKKRVVGARWKAGGGRWRKGLCQEELYNCDSNPNRGYGKHGAPQEDGNVAFAMLDGEFGNPFKSSCPNQVVAAAGADFVGKEYVDSYIVDCYEDGKHHTHHCGHGSGTKGPNNYHQEPASPGQLLSPAFHFQTGAFSPPGMNEDTTEADEEDSEEMEGYSLAQPVGFIRWSVPGTGQGSSPPYSRDSACAERSVSHGYPVHVIGLKFEQGKGAAAKEKGRWRQMEGRWRKVEEGVVGSGAQMGWATHFSDNQPQSA